LSLMYMEIARRLAMPVFGIGLPRHFIIQFDDGNYSTFIDPYNGGRTITPRECFALAGARVADPMLLSRATPKQIVMRMLQNLQRVYMQRNDWERSVETFDFLILGTESDTPERAAQHKLRGLLSLELKRYQAARRDLEIYLKLQPDSVDRPEILKQLQAIHRWLAKVN